MIISEFHRINSLKYFTTPRWRGFVIRAKYHKEHGLQIRASEILDLNPRQRDSHKCLAKNMIILKFQQKEIK